MSCEIENIRNTVNNIEGYLTDPEGETLYKIAKKCTGRGVIVEIGSWKGRSTIWMASGSIAGSNIKVYAIDPHEGLMKINEKYQDSSTLSEFLSNIKNSGVSDIVKPVVNTSEKASFNFKEPVEFIFIDGLHEYEYSLKDFKLWFPKVINGGWVAFHDTLKPGLGPKKVVSENVFNSGSFKNINFTDTVTYAQKSEKVGFFDRIKNRYVYLLFNFYSMVGSSGLPVRIKRILQRFIKIIK